ncbi:hypothetical protein B0T16DRAFT_455868 [Cercophora newfieldiana]|uniref:Ubiquitin 3 binding protein But2 C-terminal domain-containing protein n=1 Tax=Cercophora newfieldiana TaxID=92897 RepID=A0AA39Y982_9PEZI|nr:hypothetical protein B0T16DRAFT_455868 [Cercophora newfieldiana]
MKLTTIAPLALARTVLATPFDPPKVKPMVPTVTTFNVSNFQAYSVIEDPKWSLIHFSVSVSTLFAPTFCTSFAITPDSHFIGDFPLKNCTEPRVSFTLTRTEDKGAALEVFHALAPPGPGLSRGTFKIPADWFEEKDGKSEDFVGPQSFFIEDLELLQPIWG